MYLRLAIEMTKYVSKWEHFFLEKRQHNFRDNIFIPFCRMPYTAKQRYRFEKKKTGNKIMRGETREEKKNYTKVYS